MTRETLAYALPDTGPDRRPNVALWIVTATLGGYVVGVMVWIEVLNAWSGFYLPRDLTIDSGPWRQSLAHTPRDRLRDVVDSVGLLQYPLVPVAFFLGLCLFADTRATRWSRWTSIMVLLGSLLAGTSVLYRGYFTSLGW